MLSTRLASALLLTALAVPALAQDVSYQITNSSGLTLMELYSAPAGDGSLASDDLLAAQVLPSGETGTVNIAGGAETCDRDIRFVFEDGSEMTDTVNVCDSASYTLSPG